MGRLQGAFATVTVSIIGASFLYAQPLSLQPPGTISGVVVDASGKPYAGAQVWTMEVVPRKFRRDDSYATDLQGRFRLTVAPGSYLVCAFPAEVPPDETKMALPACFPSASAYIGATAVTVEPHDASPQLTIRLLEAPTYTIRRRITSSGVPKTKGWGMTIDVQSDHPEHRLGCERPFNLAYSFACVTGYVGDVKADGSFVISGVPAGSYTLYAKAGEGVGHEILANDDLGLWRPTSASPIYTGERNVIVDSNLSGVSVKVKLEVNDEAHQP